MTRDLDVGAALSRIFAIYGDQAGVLLPVAAAVFLFDAIIGAVLVSVATALVVVALLIQIVATTLYSGMVVELVSDVQDGRRDHSVGSLFRAVAGVVLPLVLAGLVVGILVAIGLVLLIVPGLIVLTIFAAVAPAVVVERKGVFAALARSRRLVQGNGLRVFGVILVVFVIAFIVGALAGALGGAAGTGGRIVAEFVATTLTAPITALAAAVLYFELRRAKGEIGAAPAAPGPDAVTTEPAPSAWPSADDALADPERPSRPPTPEA